MKKGIFLLLGMLLTLGLIGCQGNRAADDTNFDLRKDKSSPQNMSNRDQDRDKGITRNLGDPRNANDFTSDRGKDRQHVVEDDITNQNPNFLDLNRTGSGGEAGAGNHGNDIHKAKQVIAGTNEFVADSVWINGDRMWVTVHKKGMLSDRTKKDAEARLHKKLVRALPRYNIEVRVQEDRR